MLSPSPIADNVLEGRCFCRIKFRLHCAGRNPGRKRGRAVLILPDFCARVAVLEFDPFPTDPKSRLSLVRFRMKRSVPFDVESAAVSFHPQRRRRGRERRLWSCCSARDYGAL